MGVLVELARDGTASQKQLAAGALCSLAANAFNRDVIRQVALPALWPVHLPLCSGARAASIALHGASVQAGGVVVLVELARDGTAMQKEQALGALWYGVAGLS